MYFYIGQIEKLRLRLSPLDFSLETKEYNKKPTLTEDIQWQAFHVLVVHARALRDNFNLPELKSAYRTAVLKTHPDQGGSSETFQDVKKSYQILLGLVKK